MSDVLSKDLRRELYDVLTQVLEEHEVWKTCLNCVSFTELTELCSKCNPPARPPARVITFGCSAFVEADEIAPRIIEKVSKPLSDFNDDDIPF